MRLWTIQPFDWYETLMSDGVIYAKAEFIEWLNDDNFKVAYHWLMGQMTHKIGKPPMPDVYPIWAWYQWQNAKQKKPDLRFGGIGIKGQKSVLLEIEKSDDEVLLSDFDLWHCVLNEWHIADNEQESDWFDGLLKQATIDFADKHLYPPNIRQIMQNSWQKIFDMNYCTEYSANPFAQKSIQATFWQLSIDEIKSVRTFIAK